MKTLNSKWASTLVITLFFAVLAGGVIPGVFPRSAFLVKPLLCSGGEMTSSSQTYHPEPGRTVILRSFFCESEDGEQREIGSLLVAGACMAMAFIPALIATLVLTGGSGDSGSTASEGEMEADSTKNQPTDGNLATRLKELSEAHDAGLISDDEFEEKKQDMLDAL